MGGGEMPQNNTYIPRVLCHEKNGQENSIYYMNGALIPCALFNPFY
jgi:hypothetical protein